MDLKADKLYIQGNYVYNSGQFGSSSVRFNYALGANYGYFEKNYSGDDQATSTVSRDLFIDNQASSTLITTQNWQFSDNVFEVGGFPYFYTGSNFTGIMPDNISISSTSNIFE